MIEDREGRSQRAVERNRAKWIRRIKIGMIGVFAVIIVMQIVNIVQLHNEKVKLEQQVQELQQKNEALEMEKEKLSNPANVESVARDELGLVKPGEVPYIK